ncbi:MAG: 2-oxo acid dehydrogenase subunit E2, partial [Pseudonocardiaceae bacterium]
MYEQFLADPTAVDPAWHDFFVDYRPAPRQATARQDTARQDTNGRAPAGEQDQHSDTLAGTRRVDPDVIAAQAPPRQVPEQQEPQRREPQWQAPHLQATSHADGSDAQRVPDELDDTTTPLRGAAARVVANMETSLGLPTATSVRAVPAKLLADNRIVINNHLKRTRGGKISFTHLIGYAVVRALAKHPQMNRHYTTDERGKPAVVTPEHVNLGLAIDLRTEKGRSLVVASIKGCEAMTFAQFWQAYEDIIRRARDGKLSTDDFAGTTVSLTNPGTLGTNHSVPRLMSGQGTIIGVGAIEFPAAFQGASDETLADMAISKIITLTSTYDHRIIQGAESGEFLRVVHQLLLGEDGFYDDLFASLRLPYEPVRWVQDIPEGEVAKTARVLELIDAYRTRGHLMADTDPLNYRQRKHPDLDVLQHGLTLWDLDREFAVGGFAGQSHMKLRDVLGVLRNSYCRNVGVEYMHILAPDERQWLQERVERVHGKLSRAEQKYILSKLNAAESFETFLQTKYVGQ